MMHLPDPLTFRYCQTDTFQAVFLPYHGTDASMLLVLPLKRCELASIERNWSVATFRAILADAVEWKGTVAVPKFQIETKMSPNDLLPEEALATFRDGDYCGVFKERA